MLRLRHGSVDPVRRFVPPDFLVAIVRRLLRLGLLRLGLVPDFDAVDFASPGTDQLRVRP